MAEAQLLCRQAHAAGLAASRKGSKLLVTVQGDGVISYDLSRLTPGDTKALGSSQAQLLAPVQQLGGDYIAAVQPHGNAHGLLLSASAAAKQPRPLLDAERQLPLPSALHSLHILQADGGSGGSGSQRREPGCVAVVLADGTVGAADFDALKIRQCEGSSSSSSHESKAGSKKQHAAVLAAASDGRLLAVARERPPGGNDVVIDVFAAAGSSSNGSGSTDWHDPASPSLLLTHSCSVQRPAGSSSKVSSLAVSAEAVALVWQEGSVLVYRNNLSQRSSQAGHIAVLQLPECMTAAAATAAAAEEAAQHVLATSRKRRAAEAATAGGAVSHGLLCAAVSDSHLLLVSLQPQDSSAAAATAGTASSAWYAVFDGRYGCCLLLGQLRLDLPAGSNCSSNSKMQLLAMPQQGASAALLAGGSVFLLQLQLPKADLAGLVSRLALSNSTNGSGASSSKPQLVTAKQQLDLLSLAAAAAARQPPGACALQAVPADPVAAASGAAAAGASTDAAATAVGSAAEQLWAALAKQPVPAGELRQAAQHLCEALQQQQQQLQGQQQQQQSPGSKQQPAGRRGRHHHSQQQQQQEEAAAAPAQQQPGHASSAQLSQRLLARGLAALSEAQEWSLVGQLHQLQPLQSLMLCPGLLPALAAAQQYALLRQVLLAANDTPAESLVQAMQHILLQPADAAPRLEAAASIRAAAEAAVAAAEAAPDDASSLAAARQAAAAVDGFGAGELLLHILLAVSVDGVEAQAALRSLSTPAVLRLLRYLNKWVAKYSRQAIRDAHINSSSAAGGLLLVPSWAQVLEWCRLLLDAHLTRLAMLPAAAPLLQRLQQQLQQEVKVSSKLVMLKGVADHLAMGAPLPAAAEAASSEYTLELLDLRLAGR